MLRKISRFAPLLSLVLLVGCPSATVNERPATTDAAPAPTTTSNPQQAQAPRFSTKPTTRRLVVLHTSDNESELLGDGLEEAQGDRVGGVARAAALARALQARTEAPTLVVTAGDTFIQSPELKVEIEDRNAVAAGNALLGFVASALGNHELDLGDAFFAEYLEGAGFPYLSATVRAKGGALARLQVSEEELAETGGWARALQGKLSPRAKVCLGTLRGEGKAAACDGTVVGLVGATTPTLRTISKPSDELEIEDSEAGVLARVQAEVDRLTNEGVDIVVLVSHLQDVGHELDLVAAGLTGVDVIIAGGGDNRLADADHRLLPGDEIDGVCQGREAGDCYPLPLAAKDGRPVLVVATDGQLRYLGQLSVAFDDEGVLTGFDEGASRPWPVDEVSLLELRAEPVREAVAFEGQVRDTLAPLLQSFARTSRFLEGRREEIRNRQTNLGDLAADSLAWIARAHAPKNAPPALFAIRNGGGIRAPIGEIDRNSHALEGGPIRVLDLETALRFDGGLVVVTTTHRALKDTLEAAFRGAGTGRGHFPQVSREVFVEYTKAAPEQIHVVEDGDVVGVTCPGQRVRTLRIERPGEKPLVIVEDGKLQSPDAEITFATLGYLAKGGDGWFPGHAKHVATVELKEGETKLKEQRALRAFIEHLEAKGAWHDAAGYPDPVPGQPETFGRIREIAAEVAAEGKCAR